MLQVKICQANVNDNTLNVTDSSTDGLSTGAHCASLTVTNTSIDIDKAANVISSTR